jgi:peptidoglycan/LPS O-acetylase OafA/YrhL
MDALSALFYFANWHEIVTGTGYFAQSALTSPLQHTWSLAIEEQFYVVWPLLLLALWRLLPGRRPSAEGGRAGLSPWLVAVTATGAAASALDMALLYGGGTGLDRVYYGTDTRAQGLLLGASLAIAVELAREGRRGFGWLTRGTGPLAPFSCIVGAGVLSALTVFASGTSNWVYEGGFLTVDLAAAGMIWAVITDGGKVLSFAARIFSWWPLRASGQISYGLYLWHFPLYLWLDQATTGLSGAALFLLRFGSAYGAATVSYFVVEQPIRTRRVPAPVVRVLAPSGLAAAVAAVLVAVASSAAVVPVGALPAVVAGLAGSQPACRVAVPGTNQTQAFHTCPPIHVLLVGDSVALTLGFQIAYREQSYGILLDDQAILGCGFGTKGQVAFDGTLVGMYSPCVAEDKTWTQAVQQFRPQVVVVEMGWWDQSERYWDGKDVHLGDPDYDSYVESRIETIDRELGSRGAPVVLLTVPDMDPPPLANGDPQADASTARHDEINSLLAEAAKAAPGRVHLFDLAPYVNPSGTFSFDVDGSICRNSDGVHFYDGPSLADFQPTACGAAVQAALFPLVRRLAGDGVAPKP